MKLLSELQDEMAMGLILITHDLGVVADVADRIALMYAGRVVEEAGVQDLYARPAHPYAEGLLLSVPRIDVRDRELTPIKGAPPNLAAIPAGCPFHPRCPRARDRCSTEVPELRLVRADEGASDRSGARSGAPSPGSGGGHRSACHYAEEVSDGR
jgi:oligopeptide/dipeptide ABC transporter ATP-binding protein